MMKTGKERMSFINHKKEGTMVHAERHNVWNAIFAPFIGLAYAVAFPFMAMATIVILILKAVATTVAGLTSFGWRPAEAYLGGKKNSKKRKEG